MLAAHSLRKTNEAATIVVVLLVACSWKCLEKRNDELCVMHAG